MQARLQAYPSTKAPELAKERAMSMSPACMRELTQIALLAGWRSSRLCQLVAALAWAQSCLWQALQQDSVLERCLQVGQTLVYSLPPA